MCEPSWAVKTSFDFASDVTKQLITLATGIIAVTITFMRFIVGEHPSSFELMYWSWGLFTFSIACGVLTLLGLTGAAGEGAPSIYLRRVTVPSGLQVLAFLAATVLAIIFGANNAVAQKAPDYDLLANIPVELRDDGHIGALVSIIERWNGYELELPTKPDMRPKFLAQLTTRVSEKPFGYETQLWADSKIAAFDALPVNLNPKLPLDLQSAQILALAYAINLPEVRERFEVSQTEQEIELPLFLILGTAQENALKDGVDIIQPRHVLSSIFKTWTGIFPFCTPIQP